MTEHKYQNPSDDQPPETVVVFHNNKRFRYVQEAELDAARAENARLLKLFEKCPECSSEKVVAACERCGHRWEVE